jgi:predicted nuclease with TOPRIM domain
MDTQPLDTKALRIVQEDKLRELQAQQENIKHLQAEMAVINEKLKKKEKLSEEDTKFISEMGWLSALAVTISALATSL